jgi:hypothetical protein
MIIKVTALHIKNGAIGEPCNCPVALAVKDLFPNKFVGVTQETVLIEDIYYKVPDFVAAFIDWFDAGREVIPIEFDLVKIKS